MEVTLLTILDLFLTRFQSHLLLTSFGPPGNKSSGKGLEVIWLLGSSLGSGWSP